MKTVTIQRYSDLSEDQWRRVVVTAKRHVRERTGKSCEIGVGRKYRKGKPCGWQTALRVYLPAKRERVAKDHRVPDHFEIRLRNDDGTYRLIRIRSDVESLRAFVPTAATVRTNSSAAATGLLLRWSESDRQRRWGLLTVAHLFDDTSLRSAAVRLNASTKLSCRRIRTARRNDPFDVVVLEINGDAEEIETELRSAELIRSIDPPSISLMTQRQVVQAATRRTRGHTHSPFGTETFVGEEVFPDGFRLGSRHLESCIRVAGAPEDAFQDGTSGSPWHFRSRPACMQVGGKAPEFNEGIGQPIAGLLDWVRSELDESAKIVAVID